MNDAIYLARFMAKVDQSDPSGCWLWTGAATGSRYPERRYGSFRFRGGILKTHRVAWMLFRGPIPDGMCILHKCDVPLCVNPDHLFMGTNLDNVADKVAKGRQARVGGGIGTSRWNAKLDEDRVRAIRQDTRRAGQVAEAFGVSPQTVCDIRARRTWRWVK